VSVFKKRAELLEHYDFKLGPLRGRVAAAMDILTDAQIGIGTHAAYCKRPANPAEPTRDIQEILEQVEQVKELLIDLRRRLTESPKA